MQDHPRLCGEKLPSSGNSLVTLGSPPPMRGKDIHSGKFYRIPGITPAYAGKRKILGGENGGNQDHPRLCGEKRQSNRKLEIPTGSPPPMRGKGFAPSVLPLPVGITPAYAGKRYTPWHLWNRYKDHPRLCGEKFSFLRQPMRLPGSPPPMRGKATLFLFFGVHRRITPAYAGKSKL